MCLRCVESQPLHIFERLNQSSCKKLTKLKPIENFNTYINLEQELNLVMISYH